MIQQAYLNILGEETNIVNYKKRIAAYLTEKKPNLPWLWPEEMYKVHM